MNIDKAKKLSRDKIEADLLTGLVRRSIKRKERERQQAREDFKEAFEVLLESQDKSTKTQDLMLEELRNLNRNIDDEPIGRDRRHQRHRHEPDDISDESTDEESDVDNPRPHKRWPGLLYSGTVGLTRRGIVGAANLARRGLQGLYYRWNPHEEPRRNLRYLQKYRRNRIEYARRKTSSNVVDKYRILNRNY